MNVPEWLLSIVAGGALAGFIGWLAWMSNAIVQLKTHVAAINQKLEIEQ